MRMGLIGDVHAEHERLAVALAAMSDVDVVLCTGDVVDGEGDPDRACALLAERRVVTVRGNHDRWIRDDEMRTLAHAHRMTSLTPASIAFLKSLEPTASLETSRGRLLLCHGVGDNDMAKLGKDDSGYALSTNDDLFKVLLDASVAVMVCGHTHKPYVRRFERGSGKPALLVVNAGTLARRDGPGFAVLDLRAGKVEFYTIGDKLEIAPASRAML